MNTVGLAIEVPVTCYPTRSQAAAMLDVAASTLTRRKDLGSIRSGGREHVSALRVLELNAEYRKRVVNEVAQELFDFALEHNPQYAAQIEEEIEAFFETRTARPAMPREEFLASLKPALSDEQYELVSTLYDRIHVRFAQGHAPTAMVAEPVHKDH